MHIFYVQYHTNRGCLCLKLPGKDHYTGFDVEYAIDRLCDIQESKAVRVSWVVFELEVVSYTNDVVFTQSDIREIWRISE
jgi:hypothetical protein